MIQPATSNWVVPERADLLMVLATDVFQRCDANVGSDAQPADPVDGTQPTRSSTLLAQAVSTVRAAVRNAGHTPLSVYPGAVPPEAFDHVLYMAAWRMLNSTPNVQMAVITEKGVYAPFGDLNKQAEKWVADMAKHAVTPPTDPTGRDWTTAATWPPDADIYTQDELDALTYTWEEFSQLGYTRDEWLAMTNPPILGTVRAGSTLEPENMTLQSQGTLLASYREALGAL